MRASAEPDGGHLDELALDALRAGGGTPEDAAHVERCPRCRAALERLALFESALKAAQPHTPAVPQDLEYRIFRAYRDALGRRGPAPHPLRIRRWALPAAGLAAAAAVTLTLSIRPAPPPAPDRAPLERGKVAPAPHPAAPAARLESPGVAATVDIVDAFHLARALRDGGKPGSGWDADGDGAVDGADVQAIARRAVAL